MRSRALGLAALVAGFATLPLGGAAAELAGLAGCEERMAAEVGWLDGGEAAALPASPDTHPCVGRIQPGAQLTNLCTMNFIFRDPAGGLYLGTAGHCVALGEEVGVVGVGWPVATVVYDGCPSPQACPVDFALARIDPARHADVDPTLCHWGGPQGVNASPSRGQTTHLYGFGSLYRASPALQPRAGVVVSASAGEFTYVGQAQPGDSGAPIATGDGKAAGVHVRSSLSVGDGLRVDPALKYATRIDAALLRAEQATGLDLELVPGLAPFRPLGV